MFPFEDPTRTGLLEKKGALSNYRTALSSLYIQFARMPSSAFTLLEAFDGVESQQATVTWLAYPRLAQVSDAEIDSNRFKFQDEYVEWRVESTGGKISRITFTTEFPDYYAAFAEIGEEALISAVKDALPGAQPTRAELFGPNFNPGAATPEQRIMAFSNSLLRNGWNNGAKGILVLSHPSNTLPALFSLVANCAVLISADGADAICAEANGACVPGRNSDPFVCEATQNAARAGNVLSLSDPPGVQIRRLRGIWKISGNQVDINDETQNRGVWQISRNGRRAVLDVGREKLTLGDDPIVSGAQVATTLEVGANLTFAADAKVPAWARTGQESSRRVG